MHLRAGLPVANASMACCCFSAEKRMKDLFVWQRRCSSSVASARWRSIPRFLAALANGRALTGKFDEAQTAIDQAISRSEITGECWCAAELLRIRGEIRLLRDEPDATSAEDCLRQSLDVARRHSALSWELRAAISLVRLPRDGRRRSGMRVGCSRGYMTATLKALRLPTSCRHGYSSVRRRPPRRRRPELPPVRLSCGRSRTDDFRSSAATRVTRTSGMVSSNNMRAVREQNCRCGWSYYDLAGSGRSHSAGPRDKFRTVGAQSAATVNGRWPFSRRWSTQRTAASIGDAIAIRT